MEIFPYGTGISEVRGVVKVIKDYSKDHSVRLSELSSQSNWDIDQLLPAIEACQMLGFASIRNGSIKLTKSGEKLQQSNFQSMVKGNIVKTEPFRTAISAISKTGWLTTRELSRILEEKGVMLRSTEIENQEMIRHILLKWAVRSQVLQYDIRTDRWSLS